MSLPFPYLSPAEAASLIQNRDMVGFSSFTAAGAPKAIAKAIAAHARAEHAEGRQFRIGVITGASTGPSLDGELAKAEAVYMRTPFQSDPDLRRAINDGKVEFVDMHLSSVAQSVRTGVFGKVNWAIIEACDIGADGSVTLTSSVGVSPTLVRCADKVLIELNHTHPAELRGLHDLYEPADPPFRQPVPILRPSDRIGQPVLRIDPRKIAGIVESRLPDEVGAFSEVGDVTRRIGANVAEFLAGERRSGRLPADFLPVQSGVGDIANAVLGAMGTHPDIPQFEMYSEVLQDSVFALMREGKIRFASSVAITATAVQQLEIYKNLDFYRRRMVLRPQEITNHPEVIRRLGVISINTALEADVFGNVNSTHVLGRSMMNGIGGSGDFTRNAWLSIFTCPSTQKGGKISTIVPQVSHVDHSEHSVNVIVTEHGVADLRGKSPHERARLVTERCAAPEYRDVLRSYFEAAKDGHTPQTLSRAFSLHEQFLLTGDMRSAALV
ncbi:MAG TPA: succinate CoA transferase [Rariglobus sp.]|nr:succinate CoA transferase [Rariglobus sp.]